MEPYFKTMANTKISVKDVELALDAAHKAAPAWGKTGPAIRANILLKIADRIEENIEIL